MGIALSYLQKQEVPYGEHNGCDTECLSLHETNTIMDIKDTATVEAIHSEDVLLLDGDQQPIIKISD